MPNIQGGCRMESCVWGRVTKIRTIPILKLFFCMTSLVNDAVLEQSQPSRATPGLLIKSRKGNQRKLQRNGVKFRRPTIAFSVTCAIIHRSEQCTKFTV